MKKNILFIILTIVLIPFMVNAKNCNIDDIRITSIEIEDKSNNVTELEKPIIERKKIKLNIEMIEVNDSIEYKMIIKNDSNEDYELDKTNFNVRSDYYINYTLESGDKSNIVKANSSKTVYLKVEYKNEVPDENFQSNSYNDNKSMTLNLFTGDTIKNPNTGVPSYILILVITLLISITVYVLLRNKKNVKFMILIIGTVIIIPMGVHALCKSNIEIESNVTIEKSAKCGSFANDTWKAISLNVKRNNTSCYHVGDTKEVDIGEYGTNIVRISNMSTTDECNDDNFSESSCGFVVEFQDIIAINRMNPWSRTEEMTNGYNSKGGWEYSEMRRFVNNDIFNSLPTDLKEVIADTRVISGHGLLDEEDFITTDKLFLLSIHEVFEDIDEDTSVGTNSMDTAYEKTRQLDYYKMNNVTVGLWDNDIWWYTGNVDAAIKQTKVPGYVWWWLRNNVANEKNYHFFRVDDVGNWFESTSSYYDGVSPAFRIA